MTTYAIIQKALNAISRQQYDDATALLSQFLATQPNNVEARWLLVKTLESLEQTDSALDQLRQLLIHVKKNLPVIDQIAGHMRQRGYPLQHVLGAYKKYLANKPDSAIAAYNYAYNLAKDAQFEMAVKTYERSLELGIDAPEEVHLNIANIYMDHLHAGNKARAHLQQALVLNPVYPSAYYNLGNLYEQVGDRIEASRNFEKCLEVDPANEAALARLADTQKFTQRDDPLLARLAATAENSKNPDVHFALGRAYEQLGNFEIAWDHFTTANDLDRRTFPAYKPERAAADFKQIMTLFNRDMIHQCEDSSFAPVFICGMFRSGSTLLEQVLASHPNFVAGGESEFFPRLVARELPEYPKGLDSISLERLRAWRQQHDEQSKKLIENTSRLTDKRPDNFLYIGLIKAVLPSAKFVVTERDWRDIAISTFSVRLGRGQGYATSIEDIRHYFGLQTELIDFWETLLGSDLKRVSYEDLILQPQQTVSELLDWLGERWDDRCLSFHKLKNSVRTASVWQVREPLHDKSIGRWRNYQKHFINAVGADLSN